MALTRLTREPDAAMGSLRGVRVVRLSVLTDETTSPERQRGATDYAASQEGIEFDGREALDLGVSASKVAPMDRPELGSWLRHPQDFDALVCWRFDRLVRSMTDMNELTKWAADHKKVIVFAEGPGGKLTLDFRNPLDPVAQLMLTVFAFAAQMEAMSIQERVAGAQAAIRTMPLRWRGSRPPYGYRPEPLDVGWTLVPDPYSAEVITEILKDLRCGESATHIAAKLTARGELAPRDYWAGKKGRGTGGKSGRGSREKFAWSATTITRLVTSPMMLGWKTHRGNPVRDSNGAPVLATETPLMDRSEYDEIAAILGERKTEPVDRKDTNALLQGILKCASCSGPMYLSKLGSRPATYKCGFRSRGTTCDNPSAVKMEWADKYAREKFLGTLGAVELKETRIIAGYDPTPELNATVAEFEEHQQQQGRQKSQAARDAWQRRADQLDSRIAELEAREIIPQRTEETPTGRTFADDWEVGGTADRRQMMQDAGFTVCCSRGTSGGWRSLDESRMQYSFGNPAYAEAVSRMHEEASAEVDEYLQQMLTESDSVGSGK